MNTEGLEWFGPPERNTLRPLCVILLVLSIVQSLPSLGLRESPPRCAASASLLYLKGNAYMAVESPTGEPNDIV